jgi:hypothetical protein
MAGARGSGSGGAAGASGTPSGGADASNPIVDSGRVRVDSGVDDASMPDGASRCTVAPQSIADFCTEIPELPASPLIDGELECGLAVHPVTPRDFNDSSAPDATVDYAIAWREDGIYFYAAVHDPAVIPAPLADPPWEGDSVELYVDSDGVYGAPPAYDAATRQLVIAAPDVGAQSTRAETYAVPPTGVAWTSTQFAAYSQPFGYVVEAFVTAADLGLASWVLRADDTIGFDVGLNLSASTPDGGTQGARIGQYFLNVDPSSATGHPFQTVSAFCNPMLLAR